MYGYSLYTATLKTIPNDVFWVKNIFFFEADDVKFLVNLHMFY